MIWLSMLLVFLVDLAYIAIATPVTRLLLDMFIIVVLVGIIVWCVSYFIVFLWERTKSKNRDM